MRLWAAAVLSALIGAAGAAAAQTDESLRLPASPRSVYVAPTPAPVAPPISATPAPAPSEGLSPLLTEPSLISQIPERASPSYPSAPAPAPVDQQKMPLSQRPDQSALSARSARRQPGQRALPRDTAAAEPARFALASPLFAAFGSKARDKNNENCPSASKKLAYLFISIRHIRGVGVEFEGCRTTNCGTRNNRIRAAGRGGSTAQIR
jgi:hypothetical protein